MMVSAKPRKQRLRAFAAPLHARHKLLAARLNPELREKYRCRSLPVRKGDKVRLMRGDMKGLEGDVLAVDAKYYTLNVVGVTTRRADGTEVFKPVHPSNVMLVKLHLDKERERALARRSKVGEKGSK